jgi:signal peptidase II
MFYFPLISGVYPDWVPFAGGSDFQFFRPVFNVADSAISIGIFSIIIFYRKQFNNLEEKHEETETEDQETETEVKEEDQEAVVAPIENESKEI